MPPVEPPTPSPAALEALHEAALVVVEAEKVSGEAWRRYPACPEFTIASRNARKAREKYLAQAQPDVILALLAAARRGGEDTALRNAADRVLDYWPIWYADRENDAAEFHLNAGVQALRAARSAAHPEEATDDAT